MCHGERYKQSKASLQQVLFSEEGGGSRASSPSENQNRESNFNRGVGFALRNWRVTNGGWRPAISHLTVGLEWAPDPPPAKLDL